MQVTSVRIQGQTFHLHPFKSIYWEEDSSLLIADLHLGKAEHFRKRGIPVPLAVSNANWDRLITLLLEFKPHKVLFLGDLFHSEYNRVCDELMDLVEQFNTISFELVLGNHDILAPEFYRSNRLTLHDPTLTEGPFIFSHHPMKEFDRSKYNIAGHIHPSVRLRGNSRQSLRLPCFWFGQEQGLLPAFGLFTGTATISPQAEDRVFVVLEEEIIEV